MGTAGTNTSLAAIAQGLDVYDPQRIHNYILKLETVRKIEQTVFRRKKSERMGIPGLELGREEVITSGTLILRSIMEKLRHDKCLVSEYGLREGVLVNLGQKPNKAGKTN